MHHKRGRAKVRRAGCVMCKPHKSNGFKGKLIYQTRQEKRARLSESEQRQGQE